MSAQSRVQVRPCQVPPERRQASHSESPDSEGPGRAPHDAKKIGTKRSNKEKRRRYMRGACAMKARRGVGFGGP